MLVPILTQQNDIAEARMNLCIRKVIWLEHQPRLERLHVASQESARLTTNSFFALLPHCSRLLGGLL